MQNFVILMLYFQRMIFYVTKQHNSTTVKIDGRSFSNPHPRSFRITSVCVCVCVCGGGGGGKPNFSDIVSW